MDVLNRAECRGRRRRNKNHNLYAWQAQSSFCRWQKTCNAYFYVPTFLRFVRLCHPKFRFSFVPCFTLLFSFRCIRPPHKINKLLWQQFTIMVDVHFFFAVFIGFLLPDFGQFLWFMSLSNRLKCLGRYTLHPTHIFTQCFVYFVEMYLNFCPPQTAIYL